MNLITRLLFLLLKTISLRQFLPKQLPIKINLQRYHLAHEGSQKSLCKQRTLALSASAERWGILSQNTSAPLAKQHYWLPRPGIWELLP